MSGVRSRTGLKRLGWDPEGPRGPPGRSSPVEVSAAGSRPYSAMTPPPRKTASVAAAECVPLVSRQPAESWSPPKARGPCNQRTSSTTHSVASQWARRLPLIGVVASMGLLLLAFAYGFSLLLFWLLDQITRGRIAELAMQQTGGAALTPPVDFEMPLFPKVGRYITLPDSEAMAGLGASMSVGIKQGTETQVGFQGAPVRRLQNFVSIGPPDGVSGFDAQNMWDAFKGAPQDYMLVLWFLLNICLACCFCSWLCTQRSYQKAVMVSP